MSNRFLTAAAAAMLSLGAAVTVLPPIPDACAEVQAAAAPDEVEPVSTPLARAIQQAIQKVKPSLVRIFVVTTNYNNGRELKYEAAGSGVIISPDGYVITNHHVAGHAKQILCTLTDKEEVPAELVGTDPLADIAVIKLKPDKERTFPAASFGDSSKVRVGDRVLAMGSPLALSQSVTMGIVSNTEVILPRFMAAAGGFKLEGEDVGSVVRWIGHDAQIFGGNSGGPLVNMDGEIVGINEINIGISGAIPGNLAKEVAWKLIKYGKVSRSWYGLELQPLLRHSGEDKGALVSGVIKGSPADVAGLQPGDILLSIAGKDVSVRFREEVPVVNQMMMDIPVGETVDAVVMRGGKEITLKLTSKEREYVLPSESELPKWGMTARDISLMDAKEMKRDSRDGVIVTSVQPGGPCRDSKPKIEKGDIIVSVNDTPVDDVSSLVKLTSGLTKGKNEPVQVLVSFDRDKEHYLTVVGLHEMKDDDSQGINARKAWLPITTQVVTKDIAQALGEPDLKGMRITRVYHDSTADRAGLRVGDVITALNGEAVAPSSEEDGEMLDEMVRQYPIGAKVQLGVTRNKQKLTVEALLDQTPRPPREMKRYTDNNFEFTVRDVSFLDETENGTSGASGGVLVDSVSEGGWASLARLAIGDQILAVDGKPVSGVAEFRKMMEKENKDKPKSVVFKIQRGIHTLFIEMEPAWPDNM